MKNQIKIIFLDLDGTLLNSSGEISEYSRKIIKNIVAKNIYVILCSGRSACDIVEKSIKFGTSPIVVSDNGSMVFDYKENIKIYESIISRNAINDIWLFSQKNNIDLVFNAVYKRYKSINASKNAVIIDKIEQLEENVTQIVVETNNFEKMQNLKKFIEDKYKELETKNCWEIQDKNEKKFEMDITIKYNNKGKAIQKIFDYLKIDKKYSLCIGDQINDVEMFENCGIKVAMKNGNEKLKIHSDFVTNYTNDEDGAMRFFENKKLMKNYMLI